MTSLFFSQPVRIHTNQSDALYNPRCNVIFHVLTYQAYRKCFCRTALVLFFVLSYCNTSSVELLTSLIDLKGEVVRPRLVCAALHLLGLCRILILRAAATRFLSAFREPVRMETGSRQASCVG